MTDRTLEICCADSGSVAAARAGNADRVELCTALTAGGLTPSAGLIKAATEWGDIKVNVLIRPREGDFVYDSQEITVMLSDIEMCARAGVNGVVIGALKTDGSVDTEATGRLAEAAHRRGLSVTFHRAFDQTRNPLEALEQIIALGCDRILTSGQAKDAESGIPLLAQLHRQARGRISIMAGAGVNPDNAAHILESTGISELHASAKIIRPTSMTFRRSEVNMGADDTDDYSYSTTSAETVRRLAETIHNKSL